MKSTKRIGWVLATAVAAVSFAGPSAFAQQRVGGDGRALDANNRLGSGGTNEGAGRGPIAPGQMGNNIVTGNVTGGQQFRGFVPYSDPFSFRGNTGGINSDRFIRQSAGVPVSGGPVGINNNASSVRPFYGVGQTVERPPGFVEAVPGTGYVPAGRISREAGDLRLGQPFDVPSPTTPRPGQLILPGPVDPNTQQPTVITASPLYGVRQWNFAEQNDQDFLNSLGQRSSQRSRLDERTLQRLRDELNRDTRIDPTADDQTGTGTNSTNADPNRLDDAVDSRLDPVTGGANRVDNRVDATVDASIRQQNLRPGDLSINTPERQSAQYAEMQRRLNRFNQLPEQVAQLREYQRQQREARGGDEKPRDATADARKPGETTPARPGDPVAPQQPGTAQPGTGAAGTGTGTMTPGTGSGTLGAQAQQPKLPDVGLPDYAQRSKDIMAGKGLPEPGMPPQPETDPQANDPSAVQTPGAPQRERPLQVTSLATGVNAKALSDFLTEAEKLMREGKFYSALDQYEMADQVAPNDPMVNLGRAIAELGASYYARAEGHLREAFTKNPALLTAQYDLRGFLGEDRLNFLINDLRSISNKENTEPRSVFLLSFIDYNTGNPRRAAAYLDLAERRAGRPDPLFQNMRKVWDLPAAQEGDTGTNK